MNSRYMFIDNPQGVLMQVWGTRQWVIAIIVAGSIGWTIYNWSGLGRLSDILSQLTIFFVLLSVSEACFVVGLAIMAVRAGRHGTRRYFVGAGLLLLAEVALAAVAISVIHHNLALGLVAMGLMIALYVAAATLPASQAIRTQLKELVFLLLDDRWFKIGFLLNWFGAAMTGCVALAGVLIVLPPTAWGLAVLPALDIVATFGWRLPAQSAIRRHT